MATLSLKRLKALAKFRNGTNSARKSNCYQPITHDDDAAVALLVKWNLQKNNIFCVLFLICRRAVDVMQSDYHWIKEIWKSTKQQQRRWEKCVWNFILDIYITWCLCSFEPLSTAIERASNVICDWRLLIWHIREHLRNIFHRLIARCCWFFFRQSAVN